MGNECIVGALSFIRSGETIAARSVVAGNPAKIMKQVSDEMIGWKTAGTHLYQQLPAMMLASWKECEPLREISLQKKSVDEAAYQPWTRDTGK